MDAWRRGGSCWGQRDGLGRDGRSPRGSFDAIDGMEMGEVGTRGSDRYKQQTVGDWCLDLLPRSSSKSYLFRRGIGHTRKDVVPREVDRLKGKEIYKSKRLALLSEGWR